MATTHSAAQANYEIKIETSFAYSARIVDGQIEFTAASEDDWAGLILRANDQPIAQQLAYGAFEIFDGSAASAWLRSIGVNPDDYADLDEAVRINLNQHETASRLNAAYDDGAKAAKQAALAEMMHADGWRGYCVNGRFANEYDLYLAADGAMLGKDAAYELSPADFAAAAYRYPDATNENYTTLTVIKDCEQ